MGRVAKPEQIVRFAKYGPVGINPDGNLCYTHTTQGRIMTGLRSSTTALEGLLEQGQLRRGSADTYSLPQ